MKVSVVVEDGMIAEVKILERVDDDPYFTDARTVLVPAILEKQSADVDTVSGATFSSEGILEAADDALKQAIGNVE
ncbi:FMN-binding protein [Blautia sp. HCP3S3_G3]|uniref:FMN-binding protein n=1 Tax=Blautia sp. HCP3S3_G3 TaxID=3438913 RepID=UPI003F8A7C76